MTRIQRPGQKGMREDLKRAAGPSVGAERWRLEHISYKAWVALARSRGYKNDEDSDGLRAHAEPEEAATITIHASLDAAKAAALAIFAAAPQDSAFGAILIEHQILEAAHDDSGNRVRGCPPEWEAHRVYEITSDGDMLESTP